MLNLSEKKQCLEYIDDVVKALEILIKELRKVGNFPIDMSKHRRRMISSDIVCDCLYFKNVVKPPAKFVRFQSEISKVCDIYLDFYGQLPDRVDDDDITWVKHFSARLAWANRIVLIARENLSKMKETQKLWPIRSLFTQL